MARSFGPGEAPRVVNASVWTMLAISLIFLGLRLYARASRSKKYWWDDYTLAAAGCFLVVSTAFLTKAMAIGYLDHDPNSVAVVLHWRIAQTTQITSLALGKTSFGLTLLRISSTWQKYAIWFMIVSANMLFAAHAFILWLGPCGHPLPYHHIPGVCWDPINAIIMNITVAFYSALTDFALALLPWKVILGLNMKKSERISIACAMSVGVIAGITGVIKAAQSITTIDYTKPSFAYDIVLFWIFLMAEPNATIIATSIPSLRGLVRGRGAKSTGQYNSPGAAGYPRSGGSNYRMRSNQSRGAQQSAIDDVPHPGETDASSDKSILGGQKMGGAGGSTVRLKSLEYAGDQQSFEMDRREPRGTMSG